MYRTERVVAENPTCYVAGMHEMERAPIWPDGPGVVARLREAGLVDGLPLAEPTEQSVAEHLSLAPALSGPLPPIPPAFAVPTRWDLAACSVMAGCPPAALGVVAACLNAACDPAFNLLAVQTTTSSVTPAFVVRGPVVDDIGLSAAADSLSAIAPANATIGRAVRLVLKVVGSAATGVTDMATLGQPGKLSWCFAEAASAWDEPALPSGPSSVLAFAAGGIIEVILEGETTEAVIDLLVHAGVGARASGFQDRWGRGQVMLVVPPEVVARLARDGFTRDDVAMAIHDRADVGLEPLAPSVRAGIRQAREARGVDPDAPVRMSRGPHDWIIVVSGGTGIKGAVIPAWSALSSAATRPVA